MVFDSGNGEFAVRQGRWKVIVGSQNKVAEKRVKSKAGDSAASRLYDLETDPGEKNDLGAKHPEIIQSMTELLDRYRKQGRSRSGRSNAGR